MNPKKKPRRVVLAGIVLALAGCNDGGWKTSCSWDKCVSWYEPTKKEKRLRIESDYAKVRSYACKAHKDESAQCLTASLVAVKYDLGYLHGDDKDLLDWRGYLALAGPR